MALLRRGKKHPQRRPGVRTGSVLLSQVMACPNKDMSAEHWIDVKPGQLCACARQEIEQLSRVDES